MVTARENSRASLSSGLVSRRLMSSAMKSGLFPSSSAWAESRPAPAMLAKVRMASATWYTMMGCKSSITLERVAAIHFCCG